MGWFRKNEQQPLAVNERHRIERYWFTNPFGFECEVVLHEPRERTSTIYILNIPEFTDRGLFQVRDDGFAFMGHQCSRFIPYGTIMWTTWYETGSIQFHLYNGGLVTFSGPIRAAVLGALIQSGTFDPACIPQVQKAITA